MAPSRASRLSKPHVEASRSSVTRHARTDSAREAIKPPRKRRKDRSTVYDSDDDPKDPVIATYDVFITSSLNAPDNAGSADISTQASRRSTTRNNSNSIHGPRRASRNLQDNTTTGVYLLQYPTRPRTSPYIHTAAPTALRVKPTAGFIELDVPTNLGECVDKSKARDWARALETAESATGKGGTGYGLANGFVGEAGGGIYGGGHGRGGSNVVGGGAVKTDMKNASKRAVNGHHNINEGDAMDIDSEEIPTLQTQTLGGLLTPGGGTGGTGQPIYMVGAFKNDELHLTPLTAQAQLRPTHLHVDALHAQLQSHSHSLSLAQTQQTQHGTTVRAATQQQQPVLRMATALPRSTSMSKNRNTDGTSSSSSTAQRRAQQSRDRNTSGGTGTNSGKYPRSARSLLASAASEHWSELRYVDEERDEAYAVFEGELFYDANKHDKNNPSFEANSKDVKEGQQQKARQELQSVWPSNRTGAEGWLGSIGDAPPNIVRRKKKREKEGAEMEKLQQEILQADDQQTPKIKTSTSTRKVTTNDAKDTTNITGKPKPATLTQNFGGGDGNTKADANPKSKAQGQDQRQQQERPTRARDVSVASGTDSSPSSPSSSGAITGSKAGARFSKSRGASTKIVGSRSQHLRDVHGDENMDEKQEQQDEQQQQDVISISSGSSTTEEETTSSDESDDESE